MQIWNVFKTERKQKKEKKICCRHIRSTDTQVHNQFRQISLNNIAMYTVQHLSQLCDRHFSCGRHCLVQIVRNDLWKTSRGINAAHSVYTYWFLRRDEQMSVKRSTGAAEKKIKKKRARKQEHKIRRSAFWHRLQAHLQKMTSYKKSVELETPRSEAQPSASHDSTFF